MSLLVKICPFPFALHMGLTTVQRLPRCDTESMSNAPRSNAPPVRRPRSFAPPRGQTSLAQIPPPVKSPLGSYAPPVKRPPLSVNNSAFTMLSKNYLKQVNL